MTLEQEETGDNKTFDTAGSYASISATGVLQKSE